MTILVTGAAGFIGYYTCKALLAGNHKIVACDNLNPYYDVSLKQARLNDLQSNEHFHFFEYDIADLNSLNTILDNHPDISSIIHLAAQAGVRYSIENPHSYAQSNLIGHLNILEIARNLDGQLKHLLYASSSSVYGNSNKIPFSVSDPVNEPVSLYAATKRSAELMSYTYSKLYNIPATGLRFFTVYGPFGRPDMAYFSFTKNIIEGTPIKVFNNGDLSRDFTYIDDITDGIIKLLSVPPKGDIPHRILNLGHNQPVRLMTFIETIEEALGKEAIKIMEPMAQGDVYQTYADISDTQAIIDYQPKTPIETGLHSFVNWYKNYYGV